VHIKNVAEVVAGGPVQCLVVDELGAWADAWDELVDSSAVPSPFLRTWWLDAVAGSKPEFVLFVEEGRLIGGLPVEVRRRVLGVPIYQFCGSGRLCPDHLDVLAAPGRTDAVAQALRDWWNDAGSRVLDLDGLVENSLLEDIFGSARASVVDTAPWDVLPATADEYVATLPSRFRKNLRKAQKRFAASGIVHRRLSGAEVDAGLREYVALQHRRGDREELLREMPRIARAVRNGLAVDEVHLDVLEAAGETVAIRISFEVAGALRAYQSARLLDHELRDAGTVLLVEAIRLAIEGGCHEFDLLRGSEPYKRVYVRRTRMVMRLQSASGARGAAVLAALSAGRRARSELGRVRRIWRRQRAAGFGRLARRRTAE
jgi:CelD/BcsL family acetyltransferase involved in cellulose biosynthesis